MYKLSMDYNGAECMVSFIYTKMRLVHYLPHTNMATKHATKEE